MQSVIKPVKKQHLVKLCWRCVRKCSHAGREKVRCDVIHRQTITFIWMWEISKNAGNSDHEGLDINHSLTRLRFIFMEHSTRALWLFLYIIINTSNGCSDVDAPVNPLLLKVPVSTHGPVEVGCCRHQMAVCHTWTTVDSKPSRQT